MLNFQSNRARYNYRLSKTPPVECPVLLKNNYFFSKESTSDDKLILNEQQLYNIIRTIGFIVLFHYFPLNSIYNIVCLGTSTFSPLNYELNIDSFDLYDFKTIFDKLLGDGFSSVAFRCILKFYKEYKCKLIYMKYGEQVKLPTLKNYKELYDFMNIANVTYTPTIKYLINNYNDFKFPLQQKIKNFQF